MITGQELNPNQNQAETKFQESGEIRRRNFQHL